MSERQETSRAFHSPILEESLDIQSYDSEDHRFPGGSSENGSILCNVISIDCHFNGQPWT